MGQGAQSLEGIFFLFKVLTLLLFSYPSRSRSKHLTRAGARLSFEAFPCIHSSKLRNNPPWSVL